MSKLAYLTAALLILPGPALAQIVFQDAPPIAPPTKADKMKSDTEKVVCRSQDTLGSRLQKHEVCMTKQQWFANEQDAKNKVHDLQVVGLSSQQ